MYYLCNDYIITDKGIEFRDEYVKSLPADFFTLHNPAYLQINISAIVGMNGDGKSSLVELMMRLINNCAKNYKLADRDKLLRVEGIKAELYYMIDNIVYCIRETKDDSSAKLIKFADLTDSTVRKWESINRPVRSVSRMRELFYTIISNYSQYAYNTNDFREEWTDKIIAKENSEKCWLYYLFHKNDGYRTPMTIHPYRSEGNIDVNREIELTMQRLMALYIQEPCSDDNRSSFRRIGNKDAEVLQLTDLGYSKLQNKTILQYFKDKKSTSTLKKYISQIEECIKNYDENIVEYLKDNALEVIEDCLDLITGQDDPEFKEFLSKLSPCMGMNTKRARG